MEQRTTPTASARRVGWLAVWVVLAGGAVRGGVSTTVVSVALRPSTATSHAGGNATGLDTSMPRPGVLDVMSRCVRRAGCLAGRLGRAQFRAVLVGRRHVRPTERGNRNRPQMACCGTFPGVLQGIGPALLVQGSLTLIRATFEDPKK